MSTLPDIMLSYLLICNVVYNTHILLKLILVLVSTNFSHVL